MKISYADQQQVCNLCAGPGHIFRVCPLRGKCFQCGVEGHLSQNCPQRAGYRAGDDVGEPDSTLSALLAPQAESDLHDNQLDELSQSILGPVLAAAPTPLVRTYLVMMCRIPLMMMLTKLVMQMTMLMT